VLYIYYPPASSRARAFTRSRLTVNLETNSRRLARCARRCASPISYLVFRLRIEFLISSRATSYRFVFSRWKISLPAQNLGKEILRKRNHSDSCNRGDTSWNRDSHNFFACHLLATRVLPRWKTSFSDRKSDQHRRETWKRDNLLSWQVPVKSRNSEIGISLEFLRVPARLVFSSCKVSFSNQKSQITISLESF